MPLPHRTLRTFGKSANQLVRRAAVVVIETCFVLAIDTCLGVPLRALLDLLSRQVHEYLSFRPTDAACPVWCAPGAAILLGGEAKAAGSRHRARVCPRFPRASALRLPRIRLGLASGGVVGQRNLPRRFLDPRPSPKLRHLRHGASWQGRRLRRGRDVFPDPVAHGGPRLSALSVDRSAAGLPRALPWGQGSSSERPGRTPGEKPVVRPCLRAWLVRSWLLHAVQPFDLAGDLPDRSGPLLHPVRCDAGHRGRLGGGLGSALRARALALVRAPG